MPDLPMRRCLPFLSVLALMLLIGCAEHDPVRRFASGQVSTNTSDADRRPPSSRNIAWHTDCRQ